MADTDTVTPQGSWATVARFYWGIVAAVGTGAFLLSCYISMTQEGNGGALNGLMVHAVSYFTVWSNIVDLHRELACWRSNRPTRRPLGSAGSG
jgi:hypothetical protein